CKEMQDAVACAVLVQAEDDSRITQPAAGGRPVEGAVLALNYRIRAFPFTGGCAEAVQSLVPSAVPVHSKNSAGSISVTNGVGQDRATFTGGPVEAAIAGCNQSLWLLAGQVGLPE